MATRFADHLLTGTHASRPTATSVPEGTLYSCTDHSLLYQSDGATWSTWATLGSTPPLVVIADTTLGSSSASVDFSSIAATYKHLMVVAYARSDRGGGAGQDTANIRFNNDSGANYDRTVHQTTDGTVAANKTTGATGGNAFTVPATAGTANRWGAAHIWIPNYATTTGHKIWLSDFASTDPAASAFTVGKIGGAWASTAAINRITFVLNTGPNFITGSRFTLYGIA